MQRTIFAPPLRRANDSGWFQAYVALRVFEERHLIDHPDYGCVVAVQDPLKQEEWLTLLKRERELYEGIFRPQESATHQTPIPIDTNEPIPF